MTKESTKLEDLLQDIMYALISEPAWSGHSYAIEELFPLYERMLPYLEEYRIDNSLRRAYEKAEKEYQDIENDETRSFLEDSDMLKEYDRQFAKELEKCAQRLVWAGKLTAPYLSFVSGLFCVEEEGVWRITIDGQSMAFVDCLTGRVIYVQNAYEQNEEVNQAVKDILATLKDPSDLISRKMAIDAINDLHEKPNAWLDHVADAIRELPPIFGTLSDADETSTL